MEQHEEVQVRSNRLQTRINRTQNNLINVDSGSNLIFPGQHEAAQVRSNRLRVYSGSTLNVWTTNADSLHCKLAELKTRISAHPHQVDIIMINELWPKNKRFQMSEAELQISGYNLFINHNDNGRGICIYTHTSINATEVCFDSNFNEFLSLEIKLEQGNQLLLCSVYRSPSSTDENNKNLCDFILNLHNYPASHKLICGDFNFPNINWDTWAASDFHSSNFMDVITGTYWTQHVKTATRQRGSNVPSLLDLIFTNEEDMIDTIDYNSPLGKSDHCVLSFQFKCVIDRQINRMVKFFLDRGNYENLSTELQKYLEDSSLSDQIDVENQWKTFMRLFTKAQDDNIPHKEITSESKPRSFPIDDDLAKKIKKKHTSWRRYMETRSEEKRLEYVKIRNQVKNAMRRAKIQYEKNIASVVKTNPKKFWSYVNKRTHVRSSIPDLSTGNTTARSDVQKAEVLNNFFSSVFVDEPPGPMPQFNQRCNHSLNSVHVSEEKVTKKLEHLKISSSPGPDKLHSRTLRECRHVVAAPLCKIFQSSIQQAKVPSDWKEADVCAIHKKGSKSSPNNYRPVSLTSIACKVLEKIIRDELMEYFLKYKLLSKSQFGFMPGRSTVLQLLQVLDEWTEAIDRGLPIETIYMDFQKAFDSVPHRRLIYKLSKYGIGGQLLHWIEDFLSSRTQRVRVNGNFSNNASVRSGIPQGSVLGPVLFIVYINDLPDVVSCPIYLFADDTKIFSIDSLDQPDNLQQNLNALQLWSDNWLLKFHPAKCKRLFISRHQVDNRLQPLVLKPTDGLPSQITTSQEEKDLGIIIDNGLRFDQHISSIVKKANRNMGIIRRTFQFLDCQTFIKLYKALVRSTLEYGQSVWSPYLIGDIKKIESVQRHATKQVNNLKDMSYPERLRKLNLPTLRFRRLRGDMIELYKILHEKYDRDVSMKLQRASRTSRGHEFKLFQERFRLDIRKFSFRNRVISSWNDLPNTVVIAPSINSFKNRLDKHWSNHPMRFNPLFV